jgi:hypothetical protein
LSEIGVSLKRKSVALEEANAIHAFRVALDEETEEDKEQKSKFLCAVRKKHMLNALKALEDDCACGTTGEGSGGSGNNGSIGDKNGTNDGAAASGSSAQAGVGRIGVSIPLNEGCG